MMPEGTHPDVTRPVAEDEPSGRTEHTFAPNSIVTGLPAGVVTDPLVAGVVGVRDQGETGWREGAPAQPDADAQDEQEAQEAQEGPAPWRRELRRWIATLNPGRTQREYEKAIGYFFETVGVPQSLDQLSFDLLLAYRGALALRAMPHNEARPRASGRTTAASLSPAERQRLPSGRFEQAGGNEPGMPDEVEVEEEAVAGQRGTTGPRHVGPLAPATVNVRLTALRQFFIYCAMLGTLPQLSPDQIRAALRRLSIERRRPYQVLAEPEWRLFLDAARWPERAGTGPAGSGSADSGGGSTGVGDTLAAPPTRSPWGVPRAKRQQLRESEAAHGPEASRASAGNSPPVREAAARHSLPRSRAGLTGARTGQRDHALLALALATGLRAIELSSLDVGDLSREWHAGQEEWWLVLPDAKTKGQRGGRTLPLAPELVATLQAYLTATGRRWERPADRATPLFLSGLAPLAHARRRRARRAPGEASHRPEATGASQPEAHRLSPSHIRRIVDRVETQWLALRGRGSGAEAAEDDAADDADDVADVGETRAISPHALRHSTAIALLEGNLANGRPPASVEHVRGWLGHFDIRTTQGYLAHLEGRQHRRPFALTPGTASGGASAGTQAPEMGGAPQTPQGARGAEGDGAER